MNKSRLQEHLQRQAFKNILLILAGIIILIYFVATYGMQILINLSVRMDKYKTSKEPVNNNQDLQYVPPPVLDPLPAATNKQTINVSGYTTTKQAINLYINGTFIQKTEANDDKSFNFNNIQLNQGSNDIQAKSLDQNNKESAYSNQVTTDILRRQ